MEIATALPGLAMTVVFGGWFLFDRVRQFCQTVLRSAGDGVPYDRISEKHRIPRHFAPRVDKAGPGG